MTYVLQKEAFDLLQLQGQEMLKTFSCIRISLGAPDFPEHNGFLLIMRPKALYSYFLYVYQTDLAGFGDCSDPCGSLDSGDETSFLSQDWDQKRWRGTAGLAKRPCSMGRAWEPSLDCTNARSSLMPIGSS